MNSKTSASLSVVTIAALVLLFAASGPIIGKQQAVAYRPHHPGHYYRGPTLGEYVNKPSSMLENLTKSIHTP